MLIPEPGPWTRSFKNLDPEKHGAWKTWNQRNLEPEKSRLWKTWTLKNLEPKKSGPENKRRKT